VHMELPAASEISDDMLSAYRDLAATWAEGAGWADGLAALARMDDRTGPEIGHVIENAESPTRAALPALTFGSNNLDVETADITVGFVAQGDPDTVSLLGLIGTGTVASGQDNTFVWGGGSWTLPTSTGGQQFVMVGPWARLGADMSGEAIPPILQVIG